MKILAIVGSPRPEGNTSYLVDQALQAAAAHGIETEKIILSQHQVNPCQGHADCASFSKCSQQDDAPWILDKFINTDGVILGSPVYYYNMSAQMKAFVDRNYFYYTHAIKHTVSCAGIVVVGGGAGLDTTIKELKQFLRLTTGVSGDRVLAVSGCANRPGDIKNDRSVVEEARKMGERLAEMLS